MLSARHFIVADDKIVLKSPPVIFGEGFVLDSEVYVKQ